MAAVGQESTICFRHNPFSNFDLCLSGHRYHLGRWRRSILTNSSTEFAIATTKQPPRLGCRGTRLIDSFARGLA